MAKIKFHPYIHNCRLKKKGGNDSSQSFITYMDGDEEKTIFFTPDNTPIENFVSLIDPDPNEQPVLKDALSIGGQNIPLEDIKTITFGSDYDQVEQLPDSALSMYPSLKALDLSGLKGLKHSGNFTVAGNQLTSIDLSGLTSLTTIGDTFLVNNQLTSLDLSPLPNVTTIGDYFLAVSQLTSLDLSALTSVTSIGDAFLSYCTSLTQLTMGATTPPTLNSWGDDLPLKCILVPDGSVDDYQTAPAWSDKLSYIKGVSAGCPQPD